nr:DUF4232 domain-containing protein [Saccharopolyspora sp. HNM0983]
MENSRARGRSRPGTQDGEVVHVTPKLRNIGLRTLQTTGAVLGAALITSCAGQAGGALDASTENAAQVPVQADTLPAQDQQPAEDQAPAEPVESNPPTESNPPAGSTPPEQATDRCHTSMLSGTLTEPDAGAGQRYAELTLRNTSAETCTLYGYGGLQLVGEDGAPLPTELERTANPGPELITLAPEQTAKSTLRWTAVPHDGEPTDEPCQQTPAAAQVIPPDETDPLDVAWTSGPVCGFGAIDGSAYHS